MVVALLLPAASLTGCSGDATGVGDTGSMVVMTATTGASFDPDGYVLTVDGVEARSIEVNATTTLGGLEPGDHEVELTGLTPNCAATNANPQTVTVAKEASVSASFHVGCEFISLEIAFVRRTGIYGMTAIGSHMQLVKSSGNDFYGKPAWSPGGTRIAYTEVLDEFDDYPSAIWVMGVDGSNPVRLTEYDYNGEPAWSPDGTRIAFSTDRNGDAEIYVMDADGSNVMNLTNYLGAADTDPAWSPDGTKIAFTSFRDYNPEIYVMDADGSDAVRLTNDPGWDSSSAWSPDGTKIAFTTQRDGDTEIYLMDADGSNLVNLTNAPGDDSDPTWSPDGMKIAFSTDRDGNREIYVMDSDGSNPVNLTNSASQENRPAWSPEPLDGP